MSGCRTCLIHHIDKGLHIVPKKATDRVALILTREDQVDQGGEFIQCKSASDQTPAGWNNEVGKVGEINIPHKIGEGRVEDTPLSDVEVVAVPRDGFGVLRVSNIPWILSLCPSTLPLLDLVRGEFTPLLRVRSISCVTLELLGKGAYRTRPIDAPFQILERHSHGFVEAVRIPSLDRGPQHTTHVEAVFGQLHGIFVVDQFVLVMLLARGYRRTQNGGTDPNQS